MRRLPYLLAALFAMFACEEVKPLDESVKLEITPMSLEFSSDGGVKSVDILTDAGSWTVSFDESSDWCRPVRTSGKTSTTLDVKVDANKGDARNAQLVFSAPGCKDVTVKVSQKGKAAADATDTIPEGVSMNPSVPDADSEAVLYFKAPSESPLYGYTGDVYVHVGVIIEGEWLFVPASKWEENLEKCKMQKVAGNVWSLKFSPSIREWFGSGTTPVKQIGVVIRNSDGSQKGVASDTYLEVTDNVYKGEEFTPDPVVTEPLPSGMSYGINIGTDNSVTLVLAEKDKSGKRYEYCYVTGDFNDWTRNSASAMKRDDSKGVWWKTLTGLDPDKEYRFQYRVGTGNGSDLHLSDPYTEIVYDQWNDAYISPSTYPGLPEFPEKARALVSAFKINKDVYGWKHKDFKVEDDDDLVIYELLIRDFTTAKDLNGVMANLDYISNLGVNAIELMPVQEFDGNLSWGYNPNHYFAFDKAYGTREMYKTFVDECHARGIAVILDVVYNHLTGLSTYAKLYYSGDKTTALNPWFNVDAPHPFSVFHDINHDNDHINNHIKASLAYLLKEYDFDGFRFDLTKGFTNKSSNESSASIYDASRISILKGYYNYIMSVKNDAVVILEHFCDDKEEKELAQAGMKVWRNCNGAYRNTVLGGSDNFGAIWTGTDSMPFGSYVGYMESHDEERLCYGATSTGQSVSWGICGTMTNWTSDISMKADGVFYVADNVKVVQGDRFKIRGNGSWDAAYNYGASTENYTLTAGQPYVMTLGNESKDMYVPAAGTYDIYFCPQIKTIWMMPDGKRPSDPDVQSQNALATAMQRAGASAAFFLTVPGPKMIWQFGEIGYDYSINYNDRTGEKPVVTSEYLAVPERKVLYDTYASLLKFRRENPRFFDKDASFSWNPSSTVKTIDCKVDGKAFHVVGNFGTTSTSVTLPSGGWNDYINGGTHSGSLTLKPGEFRLLTDF